MNKIHKISYIENGYFEVKYKFETVVQDLDGIKMTCPLDKSIKDIIMFLRKLKMEKLQNEDEFDELKYRNYIIIDNLEKVEANNKAHRAKMAALSAPNEYNR